MEKQVKCCHCGKLFLRNINFINQGLKNNWKVCCSIRCSREESKVARYKLTCNNCGKVLLRKTSEISKSKSGKVYCSKGCAATINNGIHKKGEKHPRFKDASYRKKALLHYGEKCQNVSCPIKDVPLYMLDVHHKDGDRGNNAIENLEVLCVWCHALKTRNDWVVLDNS